MEQAAHSWVLEALGAKNVVDLRSLAFGVTSDLRLIEVDGAQLVLRRYLTTDVIDEIPQVIANEARALQAAHAVLGRLVPEPYRLRRHRCSGRAPKSSDDSFCRGDPLCTTWTCGEWRLPSRKSTRQLFQAGSLATNTGSTSTRLQFRLDERSLSLDNLGRRHTWARARRTASLLAPRLPPREPPLGSTENSLA